MAPNSEGRLEGLSNSASCSRSNRSNHVPWTNAVQEAVGLSVPAGVGSQESAI